MRLDDRLRGHHQGSEDRWEAMRDLSSRPFCSCDGRRVSLGDLSAAYRYTTRIAELVVIYKQYNGLLPSSSHAHHIVMCALVACPPSINILQNP